MTSDPHHPQVMIINYYTLSSLHHISPVKKNTRASPSLREVMLKLAITDWKLYLEINRGLASK